MFLYFEQFDTVFGKTTQRTLQVGTDNHNIFCNFLSTQNINFGLVNFLSH